MKEKYETLEELNLDYDREMRELDRRSRDEDYWDERTKIARIYVENYQRFIEERNKKWE